MCRFRYNVTETDTKVLAAVAELIPALKGKSEAAVLKYLAEKHENNQGLIQIPHPYLPHLCFDINLIYQNLTSFSFRLIDINSQFE